MGGCKVHLSAKVLGLLKASKIMVLMFPSHLSHLLRPCDDDPFLKAKAHAYRSARALLPNVPAGTRFTLEHLMLFIAKARLHGLSPVHVINGFKNTGAWLMDAYQVEVARLLTGMGAGYATRRVDLHRLMVRLEPKARREMDQPVVSFRSIPYREGAVVATSDGEPAAIHKLDAAEEVALKAKKVRQVRAAHAREARATRYGRARRAPAAAKPGFRRRNDTWRSAAKRQRDRMGSINEYTPSTGAVVVGEPMPSVHVGHRVTGQHWGK